MSIKSNEKKETLVAAIVFATVIASALIITIDELSTTAGQPTGFFSGLRVALSIYLGLFPVGYLALALMFSWREMPLIARIGLSFAISISINVISILLANIFFGFPITLARNLIIIIFWSTAFFALFAFRKTFIPAAMEFFEDKYGHAPKKELSYWLRISDLVFFASLFAAFAVAVSILTNNGQAFNGISLAIAPFAIAFLFFFPNGYFANNIFFRDSERNPLANILFSIALSLPMLAISTALLFLVSILFGFGFSLNKLAMFSFLIDTLFYFYTLLDDKILPIINHWLKKKW